MSVARRSFLVTFAFPELLSASGRKKSFKRRRARRLGRQFALGTVLMFVSLTAWPQEPPQSGPEVTLGIQISLSDGSVFYIPAVGNGEVSGIVPLTNNRFAAIRITPRMFTNSVQIGASALLTDKKKFSEASCEEILSWNSEDGGVYEGSENTSLLLSGLDRLGVPVLKVKIVKANGPPPGGFRHPYANSLAFCGCEYLKDRSIAFPDGSSGSGIAGIVSYPDAGKCVQLSGCGQCYRTMIAASLQQTSMTPDQVNTTGWDDTAWRNLVNDVEQTFTPSVAKLMDVEVELIPGNPPPERDAEDYVTLRVLDARGRQLAAVTKRVSTANCDQVMFVIPKGALNVTPGQTYRLQLRGGITFGWKYMVGGYEKGAATFNGKPLLGEARSTFLFRTFGPTKEK